MKPSEKTSTNIANNAGNHGGGLAVPPIDAAHRLMPFYTLFEGGWGPIPLLRPCVRNAPCHALPSNPAGGYDPIGDHLDADAHDIVFRALLVVTNRDGTSINILSGELGRGKGASDSGLRLRRRDL